MRRIPVLSMLLLALLLAAGCGEYGKRYEGGKKGAGAIAGEEAKVSDEAFDDAARKKDGCTEIEEFESEGSTHTTDPDEKVVYEHNPPHSGNHYQIPAEW